MLQRKIISPEDAMVRLEEACVRAERCEFELLTKLRTWKISSTDANEIIKSLRKRRFVDNARYAPVFVRDKYRIQRWGRRKIESALRLKRIDSNIIDEAMDQIDQEIYISNLKALLKAKSASLDLSDYDSRQKLLRFAVSRGYEMDLAVKLIKALAASKHN